MNLHTIGPLVDTYCTLIYKYFNCNKNTSPCTVCNKTNIYMVYVCMYIYTMYMCVCVCVPQWSPITHLIHPDIKSCLMSLCRYLWKRPKSIAVLKFNRRIHHLSSFLSKFPPFAPPWNFNISLAGQCAPPEGWRCSESNQSCR